MYEIVMQYMQISVDKIWDFASVWVTRKIVRLLNLASMIIAFFLLEDRQFPELLLGMNYTFFENIQQVVSISAFCGWSMDRPTLEPQNDNPCHCESSLGNIIYLQLISYLNTVMAQVFWKRKYIVPLFRFS